MSRSSKLSDPRRELWNSPIYSWLVRSTSDPDFQSGLVTGIWSRRPSSGTESLTFGIWCYYHTESVRVELNLWTPSWYLLRTRELHDGGRSGESHYLVSKVLRVEEKNRVFPYNSTFRRSNLWTATLIPKTMHQFNQKMFYFSKNLYVACFLSIF